MPRRSFIPKGKIVGKDWLEFKPYTNFSFQYDKFYLNTANQVLKILQEYDGWFLGFGFEVEDLKLLACTLVSYFEDFVNEIGIWEYFVHHNQQVLGYELPFYDLTGYDIEDINPQDISYLIWHTLMKNMVGQILAPDTPLILEIGHETYGLFDSLAEDAPLTDFYDEFLTIPDDIDFFELKSRLQWMTKYAYIPGSIEIMGALQEQTIDFINDKKRKDYDLDTIAKLVYAIEDDYMYIKHTSFSALPVRAWFAGIISGSAKVKTALRNIHQRVTGEFEYLGEAEQYWHFRHLQSDRDFQVVKESIDIGNTQVGEGCFFVLVPWLGEWWLSGAFAALGPASNLSSLKAEAPNIKPIPFYAQPEPIQQRLVEDTKKMGKYFVEYFGKPIALFGNMQEYDKAYKDFLNFYNDQVVTDKKAAAKAQEKYDQQFAKKEEDASEGWPDDWNYEDPMAVGFIPDVGIEVSSEIPQLVRMLNEPSLSKREAQDLFFSMIHHIHPVFVRYLLDQHPTHNFYFPIEISGVNALKEQEFLLRFFNPSAYTEPIPNLLYMNSKEEGT